MKHLLNSHLLLSASLGVLLVAAGGCFVVEVPEPDTPAPESEPAGEPEGEPEGEPTTPTPEGEPSTPTPEGQPSTPTPETPSPEDGGSDVDAGEGAEDAGQSTEDAGPSGDAGMSQLDGGAPLDAGGQSDSGPVVVDAGGPDVDQCGDDDPLTRADWVGFCADRVDDNCTVDAPAAPCDEPVGTHNYCATADEECPATQPGSAPPVFDCTGNAPSNVIAYALFDTPNEQVASFCAYVYESAEFAGEHYVAVDVVDGSDPNGPTPSSGPKLCSADFSARRHFYLSDLVDDGGQEQPCEVVRYIHAYPNESPTGMSYPVDDQKLSNRCRKMMRNIVRNPQPNFDPDIQYFAASRAEALGKLSILDTAEVACVGIDNLAGQPYRTNEEWVTQAAARLVMTGN